jgi:hypothetical protein
VTRCTADLYIAELKAELKYDIERSQFGDRTSARRPRIKIAGLDVKIGEAKADTIKWVAGLLVAQGAAIVALIKFLPGIHS